MFDSKAEDLKDRILEHGELFEGVASLHQGTWWNCIIFAEQHMYMTVVAADAGPPNLMLAQYMSASMTDSQNPFSVLILAEAPTT